MPASIASAPPQQSRTDRSRIAALAPLAPALAIVAALVTLRTVVYLLFEQFAFDSDQAVNGLMAKHLSEGRAFPLFFYGQTYMLAVESWVMVPFFWIAGPTVVALRASMLLWNIAFGALLVAALRRHVGLGRWTALVPALFFLVAPASITTQLISAQGGIPPFVYVAVLWYLRRRPLWFGAVLAIGFRHREFTLYAVPVLLAIEVATGELNRRRVFEWGLSLVMFLAVWEAVAALMPLADLLGPGTRGQLLGGFADSQIDNLLGRFNGRPADLIDRARRLAPPLLSWFVGAAQVETSLPLPNRPALAWFAAACLGAAAARLAVLTLLPAGARRDGTWRQAVRAQIVRASFAWYLLGVGSVSVAMFVAAKPVLAGYSRYAILGLLIPVGLTAAILALEPRRAVRQGVTLLVIAWAALAVGDHTRVLLATIRQPPANPLRQLADRLVERHVPVASAGYWRAYVVTFLAREGVRVASNDFVRIQEYQELFFARRNEAVSVEELPCSGAEHVANWYLCPP